MDDRTTPVGRPGSDEAGDVIVAAWRCLRRAPGTYLILAIIPALLGLLALIVPIAVGVATGWRLPIPDVDTPTAGALGVGVVVATVLGVLIGMRLLAMIAAVTEAVAQGEPATIAAAARRTSGFVSRSIGLILFGTGVVLLLIACAGWVVRRWGIVDGQVRPLPLILGAVLVLIVWVLISSQLYPLLPVLALDRQRSGIAALRFAWGLSSGQRVRTLGWVTLLGALTWLGRVVCLLPIALALAVANPSADLGSQLSAAGIAVGLSVLLSLAFALVSVAWLTDAQTLYTADLVERRPRAPTLNWAPPTSGPAGGISGDGWRAGPISVRR